MHANSHLNSSNMNLLKCMDLDFSFRKGRSISGSITERREREREREMSEVWKAPETLVYIDAHYHKLQVANIFFQFGIILIEGNIK